jgi:hypothetical protein
MSTTQDPGNGTNEMADEQAAELWPNGLREGYAEIGDVRLHYVEAGEGPLIVLLHGFPSSGTPGGSRSHRSPGRIPRRGTRYARLQPVIEVRGPTQRSRPCLILPRP